jgi:hypothetical protein
MLAALGLAVYDVPAADPPAITGSGVSPSIDLKAQLEKGLRARRPVEFQYIAEIVKLVEQGKLPRDLVDSTFVYARHRRSRQIQIFQFVLRSRAKERGFDTPSLDNQVVQLR